MGMEIYIILLFGMVVLITHFLEGITGFGCTVLALPFCIMLVGIKAAVPVLVILAWILALYIVIIAFKDIVWREYLRIIIFVGLGLPVGIFFFNKLPAGILTRILGVFMVLVSIRGLYISFKGQKVDKEGGKQGNLARLLLLLGGMVHGAFGSGGPFVVIYAAKALASKNNFRATLCLVWLTLNSVIIVQNIVNGAITASMIRLLLWCLPFLAVGMFLGNIAHKKIKDNSFTKIVYMVLLLSGIFTLR